MSADVLVSSPCVGRCDDEADALITHTPTNAAVTFTVTIYVLRKYMNWSCDKICIHKICASLYTSQTELLNVTCT